MDKKGVVHIQNGILLSHYKEHIQINSNEVDETGAPILWPPDVKSQLVVKDSDAGKD